MFPRLRRKQSIYQRNKCLPLLGRRSSISSNNDMLQYISVLEASWVIPVRRNLLEKRISRSPGFTPYKLGLLRYIPVYYTGHSLVNAIMRSTQADHYTIYSVRPPQPLCTAFAARLPAHHSSCVGDTRIGTDARTIQDRSSISHRQSRQPKK